LTGATAKTSPIPHRGIPQP